MTVSVDPNQWRGDHVVDPGGERIGRLAEIYYDSLNDAPIFLGVRIGRFRHRICFVPYGGTLFEKGRVVVGYARSVVQGSPSIDTDEELPQPDEQHVFEYYGMGYAPARSPSGKRLVRR